MTHNLIASDRVEGTPVCRSTGEQIGVVQRVMIDKLSGQIAYAVLTFGGFLGFGQKHFPVPWRSLRYNVKHGAYEFEATEEQLRAAEAMFEGLGLVVALAIARLDLAEFLVARGRAGEAADRLAQARATFEALGARSLIERLDAVAAGDLAKALP